jgi:hypothetical protein
VRSGQASPGSVARHRRHKRRLEERPSSSDAADGAECYELRDYHSDDDASARDNSVDDDSDSDATLNDDDDVTVRQVGSEARAREAPPYKGERARAPSPRCSGALLQPHSFANRAIRARSETHWVWEHPLRFTRLEKVRRAQSPSALEVEGPARGTELWPPRATAGTCA